MDRMVHKIFPIYEKTILADFQYFQDSGPCRSIRLIKNFKEPDFGEPDFGEPCMLPQTRMAFKYISEYPRLNPDQICHKKNRCFILRKSNKNMNVGKLKLKCLEKLRLFSGLNSAGVRGIKMQGNNFVISQAILCLLYTSDAADE